MLSAVFEWLRAVVLMAGYVTGSASFPPPLTAEEEEHYLALFDNGDEAAKNMLIERNLRLVAHITKKYSDERNAEDLISIGTIGLIKGINTYKLSKNRKLSSYISKCIENEILMYLRSQKRERREVFIDDSIGTDADGGSLTLADILASDEPDIAESVSDSIEAKRLYGALTRYLSPSERDIIIRRYGLGGARRETQQQIADTLGISRSYVSRIEKRCIAKLSSALGI